MVIAPLIVLILGEPGMAERMLAAHDDDGTGRCSGCVQHNRPAAAHPCVLRNHALHAAVCAADRRDRRDLRWRVAV